MIAKVHKTQDGRKIIAICDNELIGKTFEEGNLQLNLNSEFYKGKEMDKDKIKELIKGAYIVNVVGEKSIEFCVEMGIMDKDNVVKIGNVPHVEAILE